MSSKKSGFYPDVKCSCGRDISVRGVRIHLRANPTHKIEGYEPAKKRTDSLVSRKASQKRHPRKRCTCGRLIDCRGIPGHLAANPDCYIEGYTANKNHVNMQGKKPKRNAKKAMITLRYCPDCRFPVEKLDNAEYCPVCGADFEAVRKLLKA